jgi:hypothetical protein
LGRFAGAGGAVPRVFAASRERGIDPVARLRFADGLALTGVPDRTRALGAAGRLRRVRGFEEAGMRRSRSNRLDAARRGVAGRASRRPPAMRGRRALSLPAWRDGGACRAGPSLA